jgi:PAS domain S-box-containing protein
MTGIEYTPHGEGLNTVLVVTADDALRTRLLRGLGGFTIFEAPCDLEAVKTLRLVEIDLVLRDSAGPAGALSTFVSGARDAAPAALVVAVGAAGEEEAAADFMVPDGFTTRELDAVLRHALDKQRLVREIKMLRTPSSAPLTPARGTGETSWDNAAFARVLKAFSRVFAAGFDLRRVLDTFLEAIGDVVRPTRVAVLLPDTDGREFRIVAHRGLAPQIVQSVRLLAGEGLPRWLASQGRPLALQDTNDPDLVRELKLLQGVVATPLLAHGDLVAILVLGQPVFGAAYARAEIEMLFDLVTQLATVIRDIALHQQLEREKEFTERILSHMSSGVITIGRDQRVGTMNRRAEEILGLSAHAVIRQDLRVLPSPLGDLLFDTLSSGRAMPRTEIQLALRRLWIEVTTYVIRDEESAPLGAVLVFEDLTAQKELAAQKREADQFQLLTRVVARIADEIKNPLVSINTFIELIGERYDDPDFRRHFSSVVRRDVRRLVEVFEKLAGLVTEGELNFATVDAYEAVTQLVEGIDLADSGLGKHLQLDVAPTSEGFPVKVDAAQLRRALSYLIRYLTHNSPSDLAKISLSVTRHVEPDGAQDVRVLVGSRTAAVPADKLERLFDPVHMVQESLIDVGPAVSQRLVEALGGRLGVKQTRHELSFVVSLPPAVA